MSLATFGQACEVPAHLLGEFVTICLNFFAEKKTPPAIFTGLNEVIRYLSIHHVMAVVTTNTAQNVNSFLVKHGLNGFIDAVYGVDSPGSKAQKISMARDELLINRKQEPVFMVGDSMSDFHAAKEASLISVAVPWGHQNLENLLRANPDHVISSPQQLIELIEQ